MNSNIIYAIGSVLLVSLVSFTGIVFLSFKTSQLNKMIHYFVSFAVGAILGNAFLHLLPEAYGQSENPVMVSFLVFGGMLVMFLLEKVFHWNHDHSIDKHDHEKNDVKAFGYISLVADGVHNLSDGLLIGAAWLVGPEVGIAVTLAIVIHEIPQEISDFSILIHAGFTRKKALLVNFLSACTAILGTVTALILGTQSEQATQIILPLAAGGFIYLAGSDLIPELHKSNSFKNAILQVVLIIAGFLLIYFATASHTHMHMTDGHAGHNHATEQNDANNYEGYEHEHRATEHDHDGESHEQASESHEGHEHGEDFDHEH